jgi:predicted Rossmann-fold nucleotide-binding protein
LETGKISPEDLELIQLVDEPAEVVATVQRMVIV